MVRPVVVVFSVAVSEASPSVRPSIRPCPAEPSSVAGGGGGGRDGLSLDATATDRSSFLAVSSPLRIGVQDSPNAGASGKGLPLSRSSKCILEMRLKVLMVQMLRHCGGHTVDIFVVVVSVGGGGGGGMEAWAVDTNRQKKKREGAPFPLPRPHR